jgi:hypothetical protein
MEEAMRVVTIHELWRLTRIELSNLAQQIKGKLPTLAGDSPQRASAVTSPRNIKYVLARRDFSP